ncbi:hypothetical protein Hden_1053 [Hyphomicrobium denitrificans ATCC 51888]|uniref:Uncharacterized protein n=1 Tax=Hyphomicrobium denitrificans (strain ATCC 51888 / DSM 1869 / NCIMB 11706 / TK 0415) TaxID=582899 RepID=D8JV51_HYPDA|nr:hypothetical protein Hden_1053 [Hyphomicrobium denitrificans ATCC 51888]
MNLVRSVLPNAYAAKARGIVLSAIALSAFYVYYLAVDADDAIPPAAAEAMPMPPVVRASSITSPIYIIPDASAQETPRPAAPPRAELARDLQVALAKAHCYDGPVSGRWSAASQTGMSAFLSVANAHMSVDDPDEALLALVSSNTDVTCSTLPTRVADASNMHAVATYDRSALQTKVAIATDAPVASPAGSVSTVAGDERSMLDHPWAQPEMLVPAAGMTPPAPAVSPISTSSTRPAGREAIQSVEDPKPGIAAEPPPPVATVTKVSTAASEQSGLRFEGGSVIADEKPELTPVPRAALSQPAAVNDATESSPPAKVVTQRKKTTKRRAPRPDDSGFGVSLDSIQRSLTSLFN